MTGNEINNDEHRADPTFRQLVDWVEGRLTRSDAAAVASAVETGGDDIKRTTAWIREFIRFGKDNHLPQPPPLVRQRLRQSFERHHGRAAPRRRERAELMFDSRDDAVVAGVRGGPSLDDGYRLAFATESLGVLLDVLPEPAGTVRIEGQVLAGSELAAIWEVSARHHGGAQRTDIGGDANGSFAVDGVGLDLEVLVLSNGELDIEIHQPLGRSDP
ncbi:MAG: hypothetical protein AAFN30_03730 [Actinomycetota bacterium]